MKWIFLPMIIVACQGQSQQWQPRLIDSCEGCEAVLEFGNRALNAVDTLPDFNGEGQRIHVRGTIYKPDGVTSASGVVLYIYHTDQNGIYKPNADAKGWEQRHGAIR